MNEDSVCGWCHASKDGDYTMLMFQNPNDPGTSAILAVYGGKLLLELTLPGEEAAQHLSCDIDYCPFCGRAFKKEEPR